ncbi:MAG: aldo/keto reductase [Firmicutes bacterium]|nr:aldo/keto reductase [Bacillota bacterium]
MAEAACFYETVPKKKEIKIHVKGETTKWILNPLEKKAQGLVKHAGFSYHDQPELLDEILTKHPEMEFVQLQINYLDWDSQWINSRKCYEVCEKHGKPVIVMEPVKGGSLAKVPEKVEAMFKEANPACSVPSWTINFTNYDILASKGGKAKDCIECGQCEGVCPQHLTIIDFLKDVSKHFDH